MAPPISLRNENELTKEFEAISQMLGSTIDWTERINALVRLEGLIRGGAARYPSLSGGLKMLRDPLVAQVNANTRETRLRLACEQISDRRSAVARQACHVVAVLAAHLGIRFEQMALFFLPIVTKVCTKVRVAGLESRGVFRYWL